MGHSGDATRRASLSALEGVLGPSMLGFGRLGANAREAADPSAVWKTTGANPPAERESYLNRRLGEDEEPK